MKKLTIILGILLLGGLLPAFGMNANISKSKILVGADFAGDKITIFGKKEEKGNIIIIFKSQKINYKVYSKQKVFGIWQNANPRIFKDIYNIYKIQTEPNVMINRQDLFRDLEVGILNVNFYNFTGAKEALKTLEYKEAFLKHKGANKSYIEEFGKVETFQNSDLFISELEIPSDIKPGSYLLQVLLLENDIIKEFAIFNIYVEQVGLVKQIKDLSVKHKFLYAVISISLSILIAFTSFIITRILYYNRLK
jgi:uncharacterized protein (TIGR02186 family)